MLWVGRISTQTPSTVLPPLERSESAVSVGNVGSGLITKPLIEEEKNCTQQRKRVKSKTAQQSPNPALSFSRIALNWLFLCDSCASSPLSALFSFKLIREAGFGIPMK